MPSQNGIEVKATVSSAGVISSDVTAAGTTVISTITAGAPGKNGTAGGAPITRGTAVMLAGTDAVTVQHNLGVTPTSVSATPESDLQSLSFWVDSVDASTFTVNLTGPPAPAPSSDVPFYWVAIGVGSGGGGGGGGGEGLPGGGTAGQVLGKNSGVDGDASWQAVVNSLNGRTGNVTLAESDVTGLTTDLAGKATLASPTFTGTVTLPAPVGATDAATKGYVDATAQGLSVKNSTDVLSDANVVLSGLQTIDGVTMTAGQRVLLTAQTTASQNGIWVVGAGSWTRPADFGSGSLQKGSFTFIISGSVWADTGWVLSNATTVTVDTTAQTWTEFSSAAGAVTLTGAQTVTGAKTFNAGALLDKGNIVFDARAYGVVADGRTTADAGINVSTSATTLNSATAVFSPADVGKGVMVTGAGNDPQANILDATITAYVSATQVTFSPAATHTVSGAKLWVGTDNTTFISNALTAAAGIGYVQLPAGNILHVNASLTLPANTGMKGKGKDITFLVGGGMDATSDNQFVTDMTIDVNDHWFFDAINSSGQNKLFQDLHIKNWGNFGLALGYDSGRSLGSTNCYIRRVDTDASGLVNVTGGSIIVEGGYNNVHIEECVFGDSQNFGCFLETFSNASTIGAGQNCDLYFTNNKVEGKFRKKGYFLGRHVVVSGNSFATGVSLTSGIDQNSGTGQWTTQDCYFIGNTMKAEAYDGSTPSLELKGANVGTDSGQLSNVHIIGNTFEQARIETYTVTVTVGNNANNFTGIHIKDNTWLSSTGAAAIYMHAGTDMMFDNLQIQGNAFLDWSASSAAINFAMTGSGNTLTLSRSQIANNTFGPGTGNGRAVDLEQFSSGAITGTLTVLNNDLNSLILKDDSGTTLKTIYGSGPGVLSDLSVVNTDGSRINFTRAVNGVNSFNPLVWIDASSASESVGALVAKVSNASATGPVAQFIQSGTGKGVVITNSGTNNSLDVTGKTVIAGATTLTAAAAANFVPLTVNQNDTTNNPTGISLSNTGTGTSLSISHTGATGQPLSVSSSSSGRVNFQRSVGGANSFNPVVWIEGSSASETVGALLVELSNAGASGYVAQFTQSGTGKGVVISNSGTANSLDVSGKTAIAGATTITSAATANIVPLTVNQNDTTNNPNALNIANTATGTSLSISHTGATGDPISVISSSSWRMNFQRSAGGVNSSNPVMWIEGSSATETVGGLEVTLSNAGASGYVATFNQSGTGKGVIIANSGTANSLEVAKHSALGHGSAATAFTDVAASTTSEASLRLRAGTAPTSPNDGDLWNDSTSHHLMARLNGASYQLDGAVVGPASSTNQGIVRFNGTTGQLVQDSHGPIIDDNGRMILRNTNQDTALLINNVTSSGTQAPLANEILFQPQSAPGTFDATYGYGVISWYNDDTTVKDVIMQAHHHLDSDATNDHHHFSLYTSNAARSSTIKRFNVQYREDYALMDFQNTYLTISNVGTNNALEIDLNNDASPGDGLMVRSSTGSRTYHITKDAQQSFVGLFSSDSATRYAVTGDTTARALVKVDGSLQWGDGTNQADTWLYRSAVGVLSAGGPLFTGGAVSIHLSTPFSPVAALASGGTLAVGTGLFYVVTALDGTGGETTQSIEVQATPASGNQTINLTWGTVPGAASYNVYRSTTTGVYTTPALIKNVAVTSYSDTGADSLVSGAPPGSSITPVTKLSFTGGNSWVNSGNLGIGLTAPTALLHLAAGHSGAGSAPLKLTSGVNLTTPEAGAFEWDGTNAYITQTTGPTRKTFAYTDSNITGSAAKWTTARNLAGNSVDGSADVAFANKFIVQGTTDSGLSAAQFMGALGTGIVKNTTTTGVLSIAAAGTDYLAPAGNGSALTGITQSQVSGLTTGASPTFAGLNLGTGALNTVGNIEVDGSAVRDLTVARSASTNGVNLTVQAGGGQSTGTDLSGGNLVLTSGIGTGAGGSNIQMSVVKTGQGAGTTDRSPAVAFVFGSTNSSGPYLTTTGGTTTIAGILLNGQNNQVVQVNSQATANTAGQSLTMQGGSATTGATDKGGGDAIVSAGRSTGTGGSNVRIQTWTRALSTGTGFNTQTDRIIAQSPKSVTNNSATTVASMTNANGGVVAGRLSYTVEVTDGTDFQYETGVISYGVTNKAGTIANNTVTKFGNQQAATSGTLAVTWTITAANPALIQVNANSSLTPSTGYPRVTFVLENLTQQAVTIS